MEAVDVLHSPWCPEPAEDGRRPGIETISPTRTVSSRSWRRAQAFRVRDDAREGTSRHAERVRRMDRGVAHVTATQHETGVNQYPAHYEPPHGSTWTVFSDRVSYAEPGWRSRGSRSARLSPWRCALGGGGPGLDDEADLRRRRNGARADRVPGRDRVSPTTGCITSRAGPRSREDHSGHGAMCTWR